jgi:F-type H+-transporting ATPase subunit b
MDLINISTFVIQTINIAIVIGVLTVFFFRPYLKQLDEEAKKRKELDEKLQKSEFIVTEAHAQAENILDQAKVDARITASEIVENARKEGGEILTKAHTDADAARSKGFADVAHERKVMADELRTKIVDIALKLNAKIFGENTKDHTEFLKAQTKDISL